MSQASINDLQQYRQHLLRQAQQAQSAEAGNSNKDSVKFNKKLLDFDYGSEEDEDKQNSPHLHNQQMNVGAEVRFKPVIPISACLIKYYLLF